MKIKRHTEISGDFERLIRPLLGASFDRIADEIEEESVEAWQIEHDDKAVSYLVNRFIGDELLVIAYSGQCLKDAAKIIINAANKQNCTSVTFHTKRPALQKLLDDSDFKCVGHFYTYERVLR